MPANEHRARSLHPGVHQEGAGGDGGSEKSSPVNRGQELQHVAWELPGAGQGLSSPPGKTRLQELEGHNLHITSHTTSKTTRKGERPAGEGRCPPSTQSARLDARLRFWLQFLQQLAFCRPRGRPAWGSWLLDLAPTRVCCRHLGSGPVDASALSPADLF